jgi:iron-sulfur cluster repair protein YtfE (RIC family)
MKADAARKLLVAQHARIRGDLNRCSALVQRLRDGGPVNAELDQWITQLRTDFEDHNTTETALIVPLLRDSSGWGTRLVDRMLEEHVAEHAAFWAQLGGSREQLAACMTDLVEELDAHMAAEERTFLSPLVLREEVITRHRRHEPEIAAARSASPNAGAGRGTERAEHQTNPRDMPQLAGKREKDRQ